MSSQHLEHESKSWPHLPELANTYKEHVCYAQYQSALDCFSDWSKCLQAKPVKTAGNAADFQTIVGQWHDSMLDLAAVRAVTSNALW